jgi:hypothetical protein
MEKTLDFGGYIMISGFGKFCVKKKLNENSGTQQLVAV